MAKAGVFRMPDALTTPDADEIGRSLASQGGQTPVLSATEPVRAGRKPLIELQGSLPPGHYVFGLRLTATLNSNRSRTLVSPVFELR
jgi:hypothetical protein